MTAMLAGIILEKIGTSLIDPPFYSMVRALDVNPVNLVVTGKLPYRKTALSAFVVGLTVLEAALAIGLQFLSTILVSDFGDSSWLSPRNSTSIFIENGYARSMANPIQPWLVPPPTQWTFAEQSEQYVAGSNYHDTNHTY